jgi:hypothetical protein
MFYVLCHHTCLQCIYACMEVGIYVRILMALIQNVIESHLPFGDCSMTHDVHAFVDVCMYLGGTYPERDRISLAFWWLLHDSLMCIHSCMYVCILVALIQNVIESHLHFGDYCMTPLCACIHVCTTASCIHTHTCTYIYRCPVESASIEIVEQLLFGDYNTTVRLTFCASKSRQNYDCIVVRHVPIRKYH